MTSKEMERKALEQIRKIVAGLGEDSYIGTAFEGCFEIAEENINNDWACSMKQRWESSEEAVKRHMKKLGEFASENAELEKKLEKSEEEAKMFKGDFESMQDLAVERGYKLAECECEIDQLKNRLSKEQDEIIKLKAKLYDMMMEKAGE